MRAFATACFASLSGTVANAQTATVQVTHDHPGGAVLPGQTIRVNARITWTEFMQWAGLKGGLLATNDLGVAESVGSQVMWLGPHSSIGAPVGGSVMGFDVAFTPGFFTATWPIPSGQWTGVDFLWYDWTAPQVVEPTVIEFDFVADPIAPNVRLYPHGNPAFIEAQTTYLGTSILVLPTPPALALLPAAFLAPRRRR